MAGSKTDGRLMLLADVTKALANEEITTRDLQKLLDMKRDVRQHAPDDWVPGAKLEAYVLKYANTGEYGVKLSAGDVWDLVDELEASNQILTFPGWPSPSVLRDHVEIVLGAARGLLRKKWSVKQHRQG